MKGGDSMKKVSIILPIIVLGCLASCGSGNASNGSSPDEGQKVKFSFWYTVGQGLQEGIEEKARDFQKLVKDNEGVNVEIELSYQGGYDDIKTKIESGFASGNLPSLAVAYPDHVASYLSYGKQYVVNLDKYINDAEVGFGKERFLGDMSTYSDDGKCSADDIVSTFYKEGQKYIYDGTYSLPWMKSSEIMFYNLDAVKRCFDLGKNKYGNTFNAEIKTEEEVINFVEHMSWNEMMDLSRYALQNKTNVLPNMTYPVMYDSDGNFFISKMYQEEIPFTSIDENGRGVIAFESGEARTKAEALISEYAQNVNDGLLTTKILQEGKYSSSFFVDEQVIFAIGSSGGTGYNSPSAAEFNYEIAKAPASNNNPLYITQGPTLTLINNPGDSQKDQEAKALYAWKFMKYLTNTDVNTELCIADSQGYIPMRESAYQTEEFAAFLEEGTIYAKAADVLLNDISGNYIVGDTFKGSADLRDQVGNILASVVGGTNVSTAFSNAINEAKKKF